MHQQDQGAPSLGQIPNFGQKFVLEDSLRTFFTEEWTGIEAVNIIWDLILSFLQTKVPFTSSPHSPFGPANGHATLLGGARELQEVENPTSVRATSLSDYWFPTADWPNKLAHLRQMMMMMSLNPFQDTFSPGPQTKQDMFSPPPLEVAIIVIMDLNLNLDNSCNYSYCRQWSRQRPLWIRSSILRCHRGTNSFKTAFRILLQLAPLRWAQHVWMMAIRPGAWASALCLSWMWNTLRLPALYGCLIIDVSTFLGRLQI